MSLPTLASESWLEHTPSTEATVSVSPSSPSRACWKKTSRPCRSSSARSPRPLARHKSNASAHPFFFNNDAKDQGASEICVKTSITMTSDPFQDQKDVEEVYDACSQAPSPDIVGVCPMRGKRPVVLTRRRRIKEHFRRRWKLYVAETFVTLAIILTVLFLVIVPYVVQNMVNAASFPLSSAAISAPDKNGFTVSTAASLEIPGGLSVGIDPLNLTLSQPSAVENPFAWLILPETTLQGNSSLRITNAKVPIVNSTAFIDFIKSATFSESFELRAQGSTTVHLGVLHTKINIDKTIPQTGFNNFKGFSVPQAALLVTPDADGTNVVGNASIPNPTQFTLDLGNFTVNVLCGGVNLGFATVTDLTLLPGNNTVPIRGQVDIGKILANIETVIGSQANALQQGNMAFNATLNSTSYDGVELADFDTALQGMTLTAEVPILELVNDSFGTFLSGKNLTSELAQGIQGIANLLHDSQITSLLKPDQSDRNDSD